MEAARVVGQRGGGLSRVGRGISRWAEHQVRGGDTSANRRGIGGHESLNLLSLSPNLQKIKISITNPVVWQIFVDNRGIKDSSISDFKKSLDKYNGNNGLFLEFRENFNPILEEIINYLKFYRDKQIIHSKINQSFTIWFMNDMRGNIYFKHASSNGGSIRSSSPKQIVDILERFTMQLKDFIINKINV